MIRLLSVVVLVACGGARSTPDRNPGPRQGSAGVQQGSATTTEVRAPDTHPSDAECNALFAHGVKLGLAARPADHQLAEADQAEVSAQLRDGFLAECRQLSRAQYQCGVSATTSEQLAACGSS